MESQERYRPSVEEATTNLYNYLKLTDAPQRADAIFVLGSANLSPAQKAYELYQAGYAKKIFAVASGGPLGGQKEWGMPECEKYKEELVALGVPADNVVIPTRDEQTINTLTEARTAISFMREHGVYPKRVLVIARPFHQRRVNNTFLEQYINQGIEFINCPSDEPFDPTDTQTEQAIVREAERLYIYSDPTHRKNKQGRADIMKSDVPKEIIFSTVIVRQGLKKREEYRGN